MTKNKSKIQVVEINGVMRCFLLNKNVDKKGKCTVSCDFLSPKSQLKSKYKLK